MKITDNNLEKLDYLFKKKWINFNNDELLEQGIKLLNIINILYLKNNKNDKTIY